MVKIFTRVPSYSENFITIMNISFNHFCDQFQFWQEVDSAIHVPNLTESFCHFTRIYMANA